MSGAGSDARIAGLILAGGRSSRMGRDKATLVFEGKRLVDRAHEGLGAALALAGASAPLVFVSGELEGLESIPDLSEGLGPLGGLYSVLSRLSVSHPRVERILVVPVDMPRLTPQTLSRLIREGSMAQAAFYSGHELPLVLEVSTAVVAALEALCRPGLPAGQRSVRRLLERLKSTTLKLSVGEEQEFMNLNTPEDLT